MIFINTRPAERAENLTAFLQARHIDVLEIPLLALVKCDLTELERQSLTQIKGYQAVIFISETAVGYFFECIHHQQIHLNPNLTIIAVGQKTAQTFKNFWQRNTDFPPNISTPSEFDLPENNEGLLHLPVIRGLNKGDTILILKGREGRALLKNTLIKKGIIVDEVEFYQRIFPAQSSAIFREFILTYKRTEKVVVLITSLTAWQHWQRLLSTFPHEALNLHYVVLQARIAEIVKNSTREFTMLSSLEPHEVLEKIKFLP